jgi:hypothetical protein
VSRLSHLFLDLVKPLNDLILSRARDIALSWWLWIAVLEQVELTVHIFALAVHHGLEWLLTKHDCEINDATYTDNLLLFGS